MVGIAAYLVPWHENTKSQNDAKITVNLRP
jgi:hypothetical protein